jgi:membrane-bound metal-dependent hydrolase YbcI (DUF457 family)
MWLIGHLALGYFAALTVGKFTKEKIIIPVVWLFSMLPDADELFLRYIIHRGPTHSIVVAFLVFLPILIVFKRGLPYLAALASHSLIGDFVVPPAQLLWPITTGWYGINPSLELKGATETFVEVFLLILMFAVMLYMRKKDKTTEA